MIHYGHLTFTFPVAFALFILTACSDARERSSSNSDSPHYECIMPPPDSFAPPVAVPADTIQVCFRYDKGEEHHWIEINRVHDSIWGNLTWYIEGKDGVKGNYSGAFHGDTLWIVHEAVMEGHLVPREVAFLLKGDKLYEAQGTQEENSKGMYYYKHKKLLEYSDPEPMVKGPCM